MIRCDLHNHTLYSHGRHTPRQMWQAAQKKGIELFGFSEHSPRPLHYTYTQEYRDRLTKYFPQYVREVQELQREFPGKILFGMEMDWFDAELDFIQKSLAEYDFDYLIGSVHFLRQWGFDDQASHWQCFSVEECYEHYTQYFKTLTHMAHSGLFHIAAHLDLIKIFSVNIFHQWIAQANNLLLVAEALTAMKQQGMALEISSAGLRKMCSEIYPCKEIMTLAADMHLPISFASDAHNVQDVAADFDKLEAYARSYGYKHSVWFCRNIMFEQEF